MREIGKALKKQREELNLSYEDIAERTKLTISTIKALEEGDFDHFGNDLTYVKFYLKSYCKALGINYDSIRADFDRSYQRYINKEDDIDANPTSEEEIEAEKEDEAFMEEESDLEANREQEVSEEEESEKTSSKDELEAEKEDEAFMDEESDLEASREQEVDEEEESEKTPSKDELEAEKEDEAFMEEESDLEANREQEVDEEEELEKAPSKDELEAEKEDEAFMEEESDLEASREQEVDEEEELEKAPSKDELEAEKEDEAFMEEESDLEASREQEVDEEEELEKAPSKDELEAEKEDEAFMEEESDLEANREQEVTMPETKANISPKKPLKKRFDASKILILVIALFIAGILVFSATKLVVDKTGIKDQISHEEKANKKTHKNKKQEELTINPIEANNYDVLGVKKDSELNIEVRFSEPSYIDGMSFDGVAVASVPAGQYTPETPIKYTTTATGNDSLTIYFQNYQAANIYINGQLIPKTPATQSLIITNMTLNIKE